VFGTHPVGTAEHSVLALVVLIDWTWLNRNRMRLFLQLVYDLLDRGGSPETVVLSDQI